MNPEVHDEFLATMADWLDVTAARSAEHVTSPSERVGRILAQLLARDREFLTYCFLHNDSLAETAARMRMTLAHVLALQWSALSHAAQLATRETSNASTMCASAAEAFSLPTEEEAVWWGIAALPCRRTGPLRQEVMRERQQPAGNRNAWCGW